MNTQFIKSDIFDATVYYNTVGKELCNILALHNKEQNELEVVLGVDDLSTRKRFTRSQMSKITSFVGIDDFDCFLSNFQDQYKENIAKCNATFKRCKEELKPFAKIRNFICAKSDRGDDFYEDVLDFFDKDSFLEIGNSNIGVAYRKTSKPIVVNELNLACWLRRGEIDFNRANEALPVYNEDGLKDWIENGDWKTHVTNVDYFMNIPNVLREHGVVVSFIPYLYKTIYGAVEWIDNHPLIMISDRSKDLAECWFTLLHELGHVLLHKNEDVFDCELNVSSKKVVDKKEKEANTFANRFLYGNGELRNHIFGLKRNKSRCNINSIVNEFNTDRLFVEYWLRKAQVDAWMYPKVNIQF